MKKGLSITIIALSILLVGLYTVTSTYSVIIDVIEKDGTTEIISEITVRDLLINEDGSYNNTYYDLKKELAVNEEEANILMNSAPINTAFKTVLETIVDYKVHNNISAKLSTAELYNMITESVLKTNGISDETKSKVINTASIYRQDISDYIYDIEVSVLGGNI